MPQEQPKKEKKKKKRKKKKVSNETLRKESRLHSSFAFGNVNYLESGISECGTQGKTLKSL